jgi:DnaJ-class molecular chaperone
MSKNFYEILGVDPKASKDEIKKAYRNLQMKYHPDKNYGNPEANVMTQKINEAYEVLYDDQKREEYDMELNGQVPFAKMHRFQGEVPMDEIFKMFFNDLGGGGGFPFMPAGMPGMMPTGMPGMPGIHVFHNGGDGMLNKPVPIIKNIQVSISQVLTGALIPLEIERWIVDSGKKVFEKETIYVDIPQGVDDNELIILRNKGNVINERCVGDIKLTISVQNNSEFKRIGLDLILEKTITLKQALCGFKFDIHYPNGKTYTMNNNKGNIVPPEYKKIYPGMGIKRGDHIGNMIILFHVMFPEHLKEEQINQLDNILTD